MLVDTADSRLDLKQWGLPDGVLNHYQKRGIVHMFPWQADCLSLGSVLEGENLIYTAPTSAGKTLVAEILVSQTVFDKQKKALIILPFVSVVREKMFYFQDMFCENGVRVEGFMGGHTPSASFQQVQVGVCTIEKANSLINRMLEEKCLEKLGIVVVDEMHLLGDPYRGYLLELLLTKLKYMASIQPEIKLQIVGMSATLPNLNMLAKWLNARLYFTDFRPVPLSEHLKCGQSILNSKLEKVGEVVPQDSDAGDDSENVGYLCIETIRNSHSVLIFCPTKVWCENLSVKLAAYFRKLGCSKEATTEGSSGWVLRQQLDLAKLNAVVDHLKISPVGLDKELSKTIPFGVAFHHAGLTLDERDIIEGSFKNGSLRVLCATSTLSSGVNLPARRVIIRSPMSFGGVMDIMTYRQMIGRAGRMGVDTEGESILICKSTEKPMCQQLMSSGLKPIESCLGSGRLSASLKRAILEVVASGIASTAEEVAQYAACTFLASSSKSEMKDPLSSCLEFLEEHELIRKKGSEGYAPTPLGQACLASSLPPDEGLTLFRELDRARRCFVLDSDLHIIYQITPYSVSEQWGKIDWMHVHNMLEELSPSMRRVAELVGVEDAFLVKVVKGAVNTTNPAQRSKLSIHRRFYTALALQDLVNEMPLPEVARKFDCNKGTLQSLQQSAATYAGMVAEFARRLRWGTIELIVSQFQERLQFGVQRELCQLMRLPSLNGLRARALFNAGFSSLPQIATCDIAALEAALLATTPFQSRAQGAGEPGHEAENRTRHQALWVTGRAGLGVRAAAEILVKEARDLLELSLGVGAKWGVANPADSSVINQSIRIVASPMRPMRNTTIKNKTTDESDTSQTRIKPGTIVASVIKTTPLKQGATPTSNKKVETSINISPVLKKEKSCDIVEEDLFEVKENHSIVEPVQCPEDSPKINISSFSEIILDSRCDWGTAGNAAVTNKNTAPGKNSVSPESAAKYNQVTINDEEYNLNRLQKSGDFFGGTLNCFESRCDWGTTGKAAAIEDTNKRPSETAGFSQSATKHNKLTLNETGLNQVPQNVGYFGGTLSCFESHCDWATTEKAAAIEDTNIRPSETAGSPESAAKHNKVTLNETYLNLDFAPTVACKSETQEKPFVRSRFSTDLFDATPKCSTPVTIKRSSAPLDSPDIFSQSLTFDTQLQQVCDSEEMMAVFAEDVPSSPPNSDDLGYLSDSSPVIVAEISVIDKIPGLLETVSESFFVNGVGTARRKRKASPDVIAGSDDSLSEGVGQTKRTKQTKSLLFRSRSRREAKRPRRDVLVVSLEESDEEIAPTPHVERTCSIASTRRGASTLQRKLLDRSIPSSSSAESFEDMKLVGPKVEKEKVKGTKYETEVNVNNADIVSLQEMDWQSLNVVDICGNQEVFKSFCEELKQSNTIGLAFGCRRKQTEQKPKIGAKFRKTEGEKKTEQPEDNVFTYDDIVLDGVAFYWHKNYVFYMGCNGGVVSKEEKLEILKLLSRKTLRMFDAREQLRIAKLCTGVGLDGDLEDPKVASWLLSTSNQEDNLRTIVSEFLQPGNKLAALLGTVPGAGSAALTTDSVVAARTRACGEAMLTYHIINTQTKKLNEIGLLKVFQNVEMPMLRVLAEMETEGMIFDQIKVKVLKIELEAHVLALENKAHALAGRKFALSSFAAVSKVLYTELRLGKSIQQTKKKKPSTSKDALESLESETKHPLPRIILQWRKLKAIINKTLFPLLQLVPSTHVHGSCQTFTVTGRISMREPNLQNVPRDFDVVLDNEKRYEVRLRDMFVAPEGHVLLAADYCQIELRMLAHLSQDCALISHITSSPDVFVSIAATIHGIVEAEVTAEQRQRAKTTCYGIIYGIGSRSLSQQLQIEEAAAQSLMDDFKAKYQGVQAFLHRTVFECKKKGFVETLNGRRRYLPSINSPIPAVSSEAERQAVNTCVQGSAADLVKTAMVAIRNKSQNLNNGDLKLVLHLHDEVMYQVRECAVQTAANLLTTCMETAMALSVPIPVKVKAGHSWGQLKAMPN